MKQNPSEPSNNIDQIREIIFGNEKRQLDGKFSELEKKLDKLQKILGSLDKRLKRVDQTLAGLAEDNQKKIKEARTEVDNAIDRLQNRFDKRIDKLSDTKIDNTQLADFLTEMARHLRGEQDNGQADGSEVLKTAK